jgi:hypothetical protein
MIRESNFNKLLLEWNNTIGTSSNIQPIVLPHLEEIEAIVNPSIKRKPIAQVHQAGSTLFVILALIEANPLRRSLFIQPSINVKSHVFVSQASTILTTLQPGDSFIWKDKLTSLPREDINVGRLFLPGETISDININIERLIMWEET